MKTCRRSAVLGLLLAALAATALAQEASFQERRNELRRKFREARSPEEKRAIVAEMKRLELAPAAAPEPRRHVVVSGDTLSAIAGAHGVSLAELIAANPQIKNPNLIRPGDVIVIPGQGAAEPEPEPDTPPGEIDPPPSDPPSDSSEPADPAGSIGPRAAGALEWSADQMPGGGGTGVNSNNGRSVAEDNHAWDSWCLAFVSTAYGREVEELRAPDAITSYEKFLDAGKIVDSRTEIPPGAPVFFEAGASNRWYGHVAIFTGEYTDDGDPIIRTSGWTSWPGIHEIPLSELEAKVGAYTGYGVVSED
ncbi:MAG: LysM peptidoglycan-binding domain-containing protein [Planctomycetes bacterium]|nr:LysM peptidoglycan-binding domain-containing protein [Planctomycetota bacterium]